MIVLGIETSSIEGSIALVRDGVCLAERALSRAGRRHARELVVQIGELLASTGLKSRDVNLVAVSVGPGSFTGLRVGVTCAKTFAYAVGCRLAAVDTFEAIAANSPPDVTHVEVIGDALRGELYVGRYVRSAGGDWQREGDVTVRSVDAWLAGLDVETAVTGPAVGKYGAEAAGRCRLLPAETYAPQATTIARIGARHAAAGQLADVWGLEPVYLRPSGAEEKWAQRHADSEEAADHRG